MINFDFKFKIIEQVIIEKTKKVRDNYEKNFSIISLFIYYSNWSKC